MRPNLSNLTVEKTRAFLERNPFVSQMKPSQDIELSFIQTIGQVDVFYMLCEKLDRIPTQNEYSENYLDICINETQEKKIDGEQLSCRIKRAWATYVCECDFYLRLRDNGNFDDVIIDTQKDKKFECDVIIQYKGKKYCIHLSFRTENEKKWKKVKDNRKRKLVSHALDFPLLSEDADFIGNLHLYTEEHVLLLKQKLGIEQQQRLEDWF